MSSMAGKDRGLVRRAAKMLLDGATLLGHPCPYCKGVRVMKNGSALCVSCGSEPTERKIPEDADDVGTGRQRQQAVDALEEKLASLSRELAGEADRQKEAEILDSIGAVLSALERIRRQSDESREGGLPGDISRCTR